ncbi:hypothetical protein HDU84_000195, partial [Entophlyctis sp. JEL0112]
LTILDNYLEHSLETCELYNMAPDCDHTTHTGQPTYVKFIMTGLIDQACTAWRRVPKLERDNMTWNDYCSWILETFGSSLTLTQAVEAMEELHQTKSAIIYLTDFNQLVSAISAAGITYLECHLCIKYLNGLKSRLQTAPELYHITDDIKKLQQEAEWMDNIQFWQSHKNFRNPMTPTLQQQHRLTTANNNNSLGQGFCQTFPNANDGPTPLDLDNTQQYRSNPPFCKLTDDEKQTFRKNGWCTYCQDKHHNTDRCPKLRAKNAAQNSNCPNQINFASQVNKLIDDKPGNYNSTIGDARI